MNFEAASGISVFIGRETIKDYFAFNGTDADGNTIGKINYNSGYTFVVLYVTELIKFFTASAS